MSDISRDDLINILEAISEAQLRALRKLRQPQAKDSGAVSTPEKRMSHMDIVYDLLRSARRPLHISEILDLAAKRFDAQLDRESVVSALAKRIARKDRFARVAPNTFTLLPEA